ncbi:hypothetical protein BH10BDE1_BH10BDE1_13980 [soil metagenome]
MKHLALRTIQFGLSMIATALACSGLYVSSDVSVYNAFFRNVCRVTWLEGCAAAIESTLFSFNFAATFDRAFLARENDPLLI